MVGLLIVGFAIVMFVILLAFTFWKPGPAAREGPNKEMNSGW